MQIPLSILAILMFIGLVLVHEWGHFKAARRNGVDVEEYGLGLPPRIWGKKLKGSGMILSMNWLPIGGFVKLKGEHDSSTKKHSFGAASLGAKTKILLAGVSMNLLVGLVLLTIVAWIGTPMLIPNQFSVPSDTKVVRQEVRAGYIEPNSPATAAGIKSRNVISSITFGNDVRTINTQEQLHAATKDFAGKTVAITYKNSNDVSTTAQTKLADHNSIVKSLKSDAGISSAATIKSVTAVRDSKKLTVSNDNDFYKAAQYFSGEKVTVTYLENGNLIEKQVVLTPKGYLGLVPTEIKIRRSTWSAPVVALGFTAQLVKLTAQGLWHAIQGLGSLIAGAATGNKIARENGQDQATSQVGGPIAIATILWGSGSLGISFVLWIIAIISLTLAIMNILPIPALDGGRLAMILFSRKVLKRPLAKATEERLTGAGMAVLLTLILLISIVDIKRF